MYSFIIENAIGISKARHHLTKEQAGDLFRTAVSKAVTATPLPLRHNEIHSANLTSQTTAYTVWVELTTPLTV